MWNFTNLHFKKNHLKIFSCLQKIILELPCIKTSRLRLAIYASREIY